LLIDDSYTWNGGSHQPGLVTYSFATAATGPHGGTDASAPWTPFNAAQQAAARQALEAWDAVSGIRFLEVPDTARGAGIDVRFELSTLPSNYAGLTYYPDVGDVSISLDLHGSDPMARGSYGYLVLLHEIGHALGLKHPFDYSPNLPAELDNFNTTVMSYPKQGFGTPDSLRAADIEAIQYLYGTQQDEESFSIHWSWDAALGGIRHMGDDSAQTITGTALRDIIIGGGGGDVLKGQEGHDILQGGAGENLVDGGAGIDVLATDLFRQQANLEQISWSHQSDLGHKSFSGILAGGAEWSLASDVEVVAFADGRLVFDANDPAAQVMRLYQAALGRQPDAVGRDHWTDSLMQGASLSSLAESFLNSAEFLARFGQPDHAGFMVRSYEQALGRAPDAQGLAYWQAQLAGGMSRAEMLVGFSESSENRARTDDLLGQGLWDGDRQMADIARIYQAALGRAPDAEGLHYWDNQADAGVSLAQIAGHFAESSEFGARFPNAADAAVFVGLLYQNTLGRPADADGETFWLGRLAEGVTRGDMVAGFAGSTEFLQISHALTENGIAFA
jgi:Ca2+-binding RTX toxin-like protein